MDRAGPTIFPDIDVAFPDVEANTLLHVHDGYTVRDQLLCDLLHIFNVTLRTYKPLQLAKSRANGVGDACLCDPEQPCSCASGSRLKLSHLQADAQVDTISTSHPFLISCTIKAGLMIAYTGDDINGQCMLSYDGHYDLQNDGRFTACVLHGMIVLKGLEQWRARNG